MGIATDTFDLLQANVGRGICIDRLVDEVENKVFPDVRRTMPSLDVTM